MLCLLVSNCPPIGEPAGFLACVIVASLQRVDVQKRQKMFFMFY